MRFAHLLKAGFIALAAANAVVPQGSAETLSPSAQRGQTFARGTCAHCHAVERVGESPMAAAPPFRIIHTHYKVETLHEGLVQGIITLHPSMPAFRLDPDQATAIIDYLKSLEH